MQSNPLWKDLKYQFTHGQSMVMKLILANLAVFVVVNVLFQLVCFLFVQEIWYARFFIKLALPASLDNLASQPWSLITFAFTHDGFLHILFNMLWLFWMGNILQEYIGARKILPVYILGSLAGAWLYILAFNLLPAFQPQLPYSFAVGASAGVTAIIIAAATLLPDYTIGLLFFGAVKLKWLALVFILLDLLQIPGGNAGGHIAHLGGALFGFFYIKQLQKGNDLGKPISAFFDWVTKLFSRKKKMKVHYQYTTSGKNSQPKPTKAAIDKPKRIDAILDKISKSGYENLTAEEKEFLFHLKDDK